MHRRGRMVLTGLLRWWYGAGWPVWGRRLQVLPRTPWVYSFPWRLISLRGGHEQHSSIQPCTPRHSVNTCPSLSTLINTFSLNPFTSLSTHLSPCHLPLRPHTLVLIKFYSGKACLLFLYLALTSFVCTYSLPDFETVCHLLLACLSMTQNFSVNTNAQSL